MIVHSIRASSFMKYEELDIDDLPKTGTICIRGDNEAGKTTIGEAIAFALFGRTTRIAAEDPTPVINWDADTARVAVQFEARGESYVVEREVDRSGRQAAKLSHLAGGNGGAPALVAETPAAVDEEIRAILGFGFEEFRYSFYLAQKELDLVRNRRSDNSRGVVHSMVGITALERTIDAARTELDDLAERERTLDRDLAVAKAVQGTLDLDPGERKALEADAETAGEKVRESHDRLEECRREAELVRTAVAARNEALTQWDKLHRAVLLRRHREAMGGGRRTLSQQRVTLVEAERAARAQAEDAEARLRASRDKVEKLRELAVKLTELEGNVALYRSELERDLRETASPEAKSDRTFLPSTKAEMVSVAQTRRDEFGRQKGRAKLGGIIALLLAIASGAAAWFLPQLLGREPDAAIGLDLSAWGRDIAVGIMHLRGLLGVVAALFLISAISFLMKAARFGRMQLETATNLVEVERELGAAKGKHEAARSFSIDRLSGIGAAIGAIGNAELTERFSGIESRFGELLSADQGASSLLESEQKAEASAREEAEEAGPRAADLGRLLRTADKELERLGGIDEAAASAASPNAKDTEDVAGLERRVDAVITVINQARFELEALKTGKDDADPDAKALAEQINATLGKFFGALGDESRKHRFLEASSLGDLADGHLPGTTGAGGTGAGGGGSLEALRAAVENERASLLEALGEEGDLWTRIGALDDEAANLKDALFVAEAKRSQAQAKIAAIASQVTRTADLLEKCEAVERELAPVKHDVAVRRALIELLGDTIGAMKRNLGPNLARYVARVLPRITEGRYRRVEITEDLDVKVFSGDRNEYIGLIDLSFGTTDQILLSMRLGLAHALAAAKGHDDKQFLFFDEPVASFDRERAKSCLEMLREHDDRFTQVFVITHQPDLPAELFNKVIEVEAGATRLEVR